MRGRVLAIAPASAIAIAQSAAEKTRLNCIRRPCQSLAFDVNNLTSTCLSTCQFRGHLSFAIHDDSGQIRTKLDPPTPITKGHAYYCTRENFWPAPEKIRRLLERLHCLTDFHLPFFPPSFLHSSSSSTTSACLAPSLSSHSQPPRRRRRARARGWLARGDQGCRQARRRRRRRGLAWRPRSAT